MRKHMWAITALGILCAPWGRVSADVEAGRAAFQGKCMACHSVEVNGPVMLGPNLVGVTERRDEAWLIRWIMEPDRMIAEQDPVAVALLNQFNQIPMPPLGVSEAEARALLDYLADLSAQAAATPAVAPAAPVPRPTGLAILTAGLGRTQLAGLVIFLGLSMAVVVAFWQVVRSTRQPVPTIDMKAAYRLRRKFFIGASVLVLGTLAATLPRTPYPDDLETPDELVYVTARQFGFLYSSEPITTDADIGQVPVTNTLEVPVGALVEFRVTSLDVTHNFALYDPDHVIVAQTQAMPGYVNRLRVRLAVPGVFRVLCLEYCGLAHHAMQSTLTVRRLTDE